MKRAFVFWLDIFVCLLFGHWKTNNNEKMQRYFLTTWAIFGLVPSIFRPKKSHKSQLTPHPHFVHEAFSQLFACTRGVLTPFLPMGVDFVSDIFVHSKPRHRYKFVSAKGLDHHEPLHSQLVPLCLLQLDCFTFSSAVKGLIWWTSEG